MHVAVSLWLHSYGVQGNLNHFRLLTGIQIYHISINHTIFNWFGSLSTCRKMLMGALDSRHESAGLGGLQLVGLEGCQDFQAMFIVEAQ